MRGLLVGVLCILALAGCSSTRMVVDAGVTYRPPVQRPTVTARPIAIEPTTVGTACAPLTPARIGAAQSRPSTLGIEFRACPAAMPHAAMRWTPVVLATSPSMKVAGSGPAPRAGDWIVGINGCAPLTEHLLRAYIAALTPGVLAELVLWRPATSGVVEWRVLLAPVERTPTTESAMRAAQLGCD